MNVALFRFVRLRDGLSQRDLALRAGLSASYVAKVEAGTLIPTVTSFTALMRCLNVNSHEIMWILFGDRI